VYFDNAVPVRVRVRAADGSTIGDADPYFSDGLSSTDLAFLQSGPGATARTMQDKGRDLPTSQDFTAGTARGFWTDRTPAGRVWRPLDRAMFGAAATEASGLANPGAAKGWLGFEAGGFMTYFETTSQVQCWAEKGGIAFAAASRSSDLPPTDIPLRGVPIGFASYVNNDRTTSEDSGWSFNAWAFYGMANRNPDVEAGAIGIEVNVANQGNEVPISPFLMGAEGATVAAWLRTGGEVSEAGITVNAASAAMGIVRDATNASAQFLKGIVVQADALKPNGAGNSIAMELARLHELRWVRDGAASRSGWVRSDATSTSTGVVFTNNGLQVRNEAEQAVFAVSAVASAANFLRAAGVAAGAAPTLVADGTDTNIDLALTPKGTGVVQFGFFTSNADAPVTGYITIRDGGGTLRKLATIA
jgi:hypothetical protein